MTLRSGRSRSAVILIRPSLPSRTLAQFVAAADSSQQQTRSSPAVDRTAV